MTRIKNLPLLDRYTYLPKHHNYKPFKISDFSTNVVDKQKPATIPEPAIQPTAPTKNIGSNQYIIPKRLKGYVKVGTEYPKYDPPVCKPESKPPTKTTFSDLAPVKDRPGGVDPFYKQMAPPTQPPSSEFKPNAILSIRDKDLQVINSHLSFPDKGLIFRLGNQARDIVLVPRRDALKHIQKQDDHP